MGAIIGAHVHITGAHVAPSSGEATGASPLYVICMPLYTVLHSYTYSRLHKGVTDRLPLETYDLVRERGSSHLSPYKLGQLPGPHEEPASRKEEQSWNSLPGSM